MVLLFFDPTQRISKVDKQLCDYMAENYKPCVFVVNKWDLMADSMLTEKWVSYLHDTFRTMRYVPIAFITGQTGKNVKALLNHAQMLFKQVAAAGDHGRFEPRACARPWSDNPPPLHNNHRPKIYYATQVGVAAADDRAVLQRSGGLARALSALSAERVSRAAAVYRSADQALSCASVAHGDRRDEVEPLPTCQRPSRRTRSESLS